MTRRRQDSGSNRSTKSRDLWARTRSRYSAWATLLCWSFFSLGPALAQELVTDRPDFTESAVVVPVRSIQIETGVTYADEQDDEVVSGPELLVRWGLADRLELRFGLPDRIEPNSSRSGTSDASFGAKFEFGATASGWQRAIIAGTSLPTGDPGFTSDEFDPEVIFVLGRDLSDLWSFGTQLGVGRVTEEGDRLTSFGATAVFGRAVGDRYGLFAELAIEEIEGSDSSVILHHGYTALLRANLQVDVHFGWGVSDGAPDFLAGVGLSWRR